MSGRKRNFTWGVILLSGVLFTSYQIYNTEGADDPSLGKKENETIQKITAPPIPDKLFFAEEEVPLHNFDVRESFDQELMVNTYFHSQTMRFLKLAPRYFDIIEPLLKRDSIPDDFKYLALAESGFNPKAISPAGAVGIWQLMKGTAWELGLEVNSEIDERYHIEKSTEAACKYLHESYKKYGNWATVAASYNAGRRGIDRQVERQNEEHYYELLLNEETSRYVFRIMALKTILDDPEAYGFFLSKDDIYPSVPVKIVKVNGKVDSFADFAEEHGINYKILKYFNPWLREAYLINPNGKTYEIKIPKGKFRKFE